MSTPIRHREEALVAAIETAIQQMGWLDSGDAEDAAPEIADALADLLAARDRRVRGEALREAADWMKTDFTHGPGWVGNRIAYLLRDRADRVEGTGGEVG